VNTKKALKEKRKTNCGGKIKGKKTVIDSFGMQQNVGLKLIIFHSL